MSEKSAVLISLSSGVGALFAVVEWLVAVSFAVGREPGLLAQLATVVCVYSVVGLFFGVLSFLLVRTVPSIPAGPGSFVAPILGFLGMLLAMSNFGITVGMLVLGALAAVAMVGFVWIVLERHPRVLTATGSWLLVGIGLLGLTLRHVPVGELSLRALVSLAAAGLVAAIARRVTGSTRLALTSALVAAGLALCAFSPHVLLGKPQPRLGKQSRPSVLLITIDTLRADRLGSYGYDRARTPRIDQLAREAVLFEQAVTVSPWTGPSHATMFTGLLPSRHGVRLNGQRLDSQIPSITAILGRLGFSSAAFVSGLPLKRKIGLDVGFQLYDDDFRDFRWFHDRVYNLSLAKLFRKVLAAHGCRFYGMSRDAESVTRRALDWLNESTDLPFFLWVHYFDPHLPYEVHSSFLPERAKAYSGLADGRWYGRSRGELAEIVSEPGGLAHMLDLYDAEISYTDHHVGLLVAAARQAAGNNGLWEIVTADHGESMGEHGILFGRDLYEPTARVPLIVRPPRDSGITPRRVTTLVSTVDIAATILQAVGHSPIPSDGRSLIPIITGEVEEPARSAVMLLDPGESDSMSPAVSVRKEGWKLIRRAPGWEGRRWMKAREELYDLANDDGELQDLSSVRLVRATELGELLSGSELSRSAIKLDLLEDELKKLRSLGYFN